MRKHLKTLFVTTDGSYLSKDGSNIVVKIYGEERGRIPFHRIGAVTG